MHISPRRTSSSATASADKILRALRTLAASAILTLTAASVANAVIVRGYVTDALGAAVPNARVQLIQGQTTAAFAVSGPDGSFEIRSASPGRFVLLTSAPTFAPAIGQDFYGGRTDVLTRDVSLAAETVHQQVSVTATGTPTPLPQLTAPVTLIPQDELATRVGIVDDLRQSPGVNVVQTGQAGATTELFVRGGDSTANKVLIDGIPAENIGGRFDFGTVSSTGLAGLELYRGANSALFGSDSLASVVNLSTPRGTSLKPVLNYSGDAGNLHTWRNEATLSGTHSRADYLLAFSRFDTSNALPLNRYHASTSSANLGYNFSGNTQLRFTLRNAVSAFGDPNGHDFFGISANAKVADQDLYSGVTLENRTLGDWHNLLRYGIARKREQYTEFSPVGLAVPGKYGPTYYGNLVTIRGANGYTGTGQAAIAYDNVYPVQYDSVSNRDELYYQSDYTFRHNLTALFGFRYENERGSFTTVGTTPNQQTQRTNFEYNLQFQGDLKNRLFYSVGGSLQKNHLYGIAGTPRLGLAWVPVRADRSRYFRGTRLRANVATGVQEPSLSAEFYSLYGQLNLAGHTADIATYHIAPISALRSRTFDVGIDQNLVGDKLVLKAGYFHNQFSHQVEYVSYGTLQTIFGLQSSIAKVYGADLNSLAFRAQGVELELQYQPLSRLFLRGGYTYLASIVSQSFSSDAIAASTNPNFPGILIGSTSPLVGQRPFRRPPQTGYFAVQYTGTKWTGAFKGALSSKADDSTFLSYADLNGGNTLLLPNRNLDFGYAKLDLYGTYAANHYVTVFTDLSNLLNDQHIGPIGFPGLPFTVRAGLKLRLGGD